MKESHLADMVKIMSGKHPESFFLQLDNDALWQQISSSALIMEKSFVQFSI